MSRGRHGGAMRACRLWLAALGFCALMTGEAGAQDAGAAPAVVPVLTISTENTPDHVQTRVLRLFADRLTERLEGRLSVVVHDSARLFRDRDVIEAVGAGRMDMAAPGLWHLDRYEPNFAVFLLPVFYGRENAVNYAVRDGAVGRDLAARLEAATGVHVLGRWIDLGEAHIFSHDPVTGPEDFRGLRIRVAGGEGNAARIRALGADSRVIPWPDLPQALEADAVDGTLTSAATVASADLWRYGLRHAYLDSQYFPQYVPIVSGRLWQRLPEPVRTAMTETWDGLVDDARAMAAAEQNAAMDTLEENGFTIVRPSADVLAATRQVLMEQQPDLVRSLGLDPAVVLDVTQALR